MDNILSNSWVVVSESVQVKGKSMRFVDRLSTKIINKDSFVLLLNVRLFNVHHHWRVFLIFIF